MNVLDTLKKISPAFAGLLVTSLAAACTPESDESTADLDEDSLGVETALLTQVSCSEVSGTDIHRSLVVTDPEVLTKFSFTRTMNKIRATAGAASSVTTLALYQAWMETFRSECDDPRVDPNGYGFACDLRGEGKLATVNPFDAASTVTFVPVGLFNRFDLAPSSGAHCGEYRIVYAMQTDSSVVRGRAFVIFEGALPNPDPASGVDACLPVAQFWQSLTDDPDVNSRAAKLEKFYYTGGAVPGFENMVRAAHYGLATNADPAGAGQIRTNTLIFPSPFDQPMWHLREFKLRRTCDDPASPSTCSLAVQHVTVKTNPAEGLFAGTHAKAGAFRAAFLSQVANLDAVTLTGIKMGINDQFNEWDSISGPDVPRPLNPFEIEVKYTAFADSTIRDKIATKLSTLGDSLSADDILNRATTQTCGGCHQASNGQDLGGGLTWPSSLGFVHINEQGSLSPALTGTFLPRRKVVLQKFINTRCTGTASPVAEDTTVGGSADGAAN